MRSISAIERSASGRLGIFTPPFKFREHWGQLALHLVVSSRVTDLRSRSGNTSRILKIWIVAQYAMAGRLRVFLESLASGAAFWPLSAAAAALSPLLCRRIRISSAGSCATSACSRHRSSVFSSACDCLEAATIFSSGAGYSSCKLPKIAKETRFCLAKYTWSKSVWTAISVRLQPCGRLVPYADAEYRSNNPSSPDTVQRSKAFCWRDGTACLGRVVAASPLAVRVVLSAVRCLAGQSGVQVAGIRGHAYRGCSHQTARKESGN
jgi:hypothetical protein